jgi:hypothetical protein
VKWCGSFKGRGNQEYCPDFLFPTPPFSASAPFFGDPIIAVVDPIDAGRGGCLPDRSA